MAGQQVSEALQRFVDDELLRAPLLFNQALAGTIDGARKAMAAMLPLQRAAVSELLRSLPAHQARMADYFLRSLSEQVSAHLLRQAPQALNKPQAPTALSLVDEDAVALDVELSRTIEAIRTSAEYELRELQTYLSALVGDPDVARDHNPFRAQAFARALWDASQALPLSRAHQVAFVRHAGPALAQVLRLSYAAATSRLEAQGVEPAAYRTVILPGGSRRDGRFAATTYSPDLQIIRESMPVTLVAPLSYEGQAPPPPQPPHRELRPDLAREATSRAHRQTVALVSRLFDAMIADERVPADVSLLISGLQDPAMRLALRDGNLLERDQHPLWRFINRLVFEAEMAPDAADPERVRLLKTAQATIDQLTREPEQTAGLHAWAMDQLDNFLRKRLLRRLTAVASHIGALQKLEDKLGAGHTAPSTLHGTLDVPLLDTVPADLMADPPAGSAEAWLERLRPGDWVRMFLQGRWIQAQMLWPGERREIWLFGDGASDATWAVRRGALLLMHEQGLLKSLKQRSIVGSAAARVQEQIAAAA